MCRVFVGSAVLLLSLSPIAPAQVKLQHNYLEGSKSQVEVEVESHQILTIAGSAVVSLKDGIVQLKRKSDGMVISVPLSRLSEVDRKFLENK